MDDLELAKRAFIAAHGRFGQGESRRDPELWYASLGETLWWIFALDEHYRLFNEAAYLVYQQDDIHGHVIPGLWYARNFVGHQIANLVSDPLGRSFLRGQEIPSIRMQQLAWREDLAVRPGRRSHQRNKFKPDRQRDCYDQHLAGNPIRYGLRGANRFFIRKEKALHNSIGLI